MDAKGDENPAAGSNGSCLCEEGSCICCTCESNSKLPPKNNKDREAAPKVCKCSGSPQKTDQITAVLSTKNNLVMVQPTVKPKAEIVLTTMDYNNRRNSITKERDISTSCTCLSSKSDCKSQSVTSSIQKAKKPTKPPPEKIEEENGVVKDPTTKKNVDGLGKNDSGEDKRNCCMRLCSKLKGKKSSKDSKSAKSSKSVKEVNDSKSTKSKSEAKPTSNAIKPNDNFAQTDPIKTENTPVQVSPGPRSQTEPSIAMGESTQEYSTIQAQGNTCNCLCGKCGGPCNTNTIVIPRDVPSNLMGYKNNNGSNEENLENLRSSIKSEAKVTKRGIEEILTQLDKQRRDIRELREMFNVFLKLSREVFVMQALGVGDGPFSSRLSKSYSPSPYKKSSDDALSDSSSFWNRKRNSQEREGKTRSQGLQATPTGQASSATSDPKEATSDANEKTAEKGITTEKRKNCTFFNWCK